MKLNFSPHFQSNSIIDLHDNEWLEKQRISGKVVADCLKMLVNEVKSGTQKTMQELDHLAGEFIRDQKCISTFLNYRGFSGNICISINRTLVHGIPGAERLNDGDLVSFDLGATFEGVISDAARTTVFGNFKDPQHELLINTTRECLERAISEVKIGKRVGLIGETIYRHAKSKEFSVVDNYGGHSITRDRRDPSIGIPHAPPFVSNRSEPNEGPRIQAGMTLAIEPLLVIGKSNETRVLGDGWSVECSNLCAHFEDSIFVREDGEVEILTR